MSQETESDCGALAVSWALLVLSQVFRIAHVEVGDTDVNKRRKHPQSQALPFASSTPSTKPPSASGLLASTEAPSLHTFSPLSLTGTDPFGRSDKGVWGGLLLWLPFIMVPTGLTSASYRHAKSTDVFSAGNNEVNSSEPTWLLSFMAQFKVLIFVCLFVCFFSIYSFGHYWFTDWNMVEKDTKPKWFYWCVYVCVNVCIWLWRPEFDVRGLS